jgi:hypothetical protein
MNLQVLAVDGEQVKRDLRGSTPRLPNKKASRSSEEVPSRSSGRRTEASSPNMW